MGFPVLLLVAAVVSGMVGMVADDAAWAFVLAVVFLFAAATACAARWGVRQ